MNVERHHREAGFTIGRNSSERCTQYDRLKHPTRFTFLYNLLLPIFSVVNVNRAYPYVWVEGILAEQDSAASKVGDAETVCEGFVLQIFNSFL